MARTLPRGSTRASGSKRRGQTSGVVRSRCGVEADRTSRSRILPDQSSTSYSTSRTLAGTDARHLSSGSWVNPGQAEIGDGILETAVVVDISLVVPPPASTAVRRTGCSWWCLG
eukprot:7133819-Pyramimonas_sp.AAC.1